MFTTPRTPVAAALLLACTALGLPIAARGQATEPQRVEVTGSAIKRIDAETAVPVTVYRIEDLKQQGVGSVEQVIQNLPFSTSLTSTAQGVGSGSGGASFADLRGIGGNKTLVLLNGRRIANNALEGSIPDLTMIPFAALDRVEVLRDGASALYGTDAIGGVINFITRRNYEAGEISLNAELPERSGGRRYGAHGAIGFGDLAGSGFNLLGVFDVQRQERIGSQQRGFGSRGFIPERGFDGTSGTTFPANYAQTQTVGGVNTTFNANPSFPGCAPIGPRRLPWRLDQHRRQHHQLPLRPHALHRPGAQVRTRVVLRQGFDGAGHRAHALRRILHHAPHRAGPHRPGAADRHHDVRELALLSRRRHHAGAE